MLRSAARARVLMGDAAIHPINEIARRSGEGRVATAESTYKIRGGPLARRGMRVFPSYLGAGPGFFIEKSKWNMITQDIAAALELVVGR